MGLDRPLKPGVGTRPDRPTTLPGRPGSSGIGKLPNPPGSRPVRPALPDRPAVGNRPNFGDRNNVGNRWGNNNVINRRPSWVNINNSTNVGIRSRWNDTLRRPGWRNPGLGRRGYWNGWADGVRHGWRHYHHHGDWFNGRWWGRHPHGLGGWHYHYWRHRYGWNYWWTVPAWPAVTGWFAWSTPDTVWSEPVYYDYGSGGNVVYEDNSVYIGGTEVATAEEFAMSAMDLATVEPPASEEEAAEAEWLPLGTFAVSTDERDTDPTLVVQLAVDREGIVAGTLYNTETDEAQSVQGAVDRETQRVAFRIGESEELVAETGLYNLTQDEAPLLVHFGADKTENYLLVRLEEPEEPEEKSEVESGEAAAE